MHELKRRLRKEIDEIERKIEKRGDIDMGDIEALSRLTDTIKNIDKICLLESGEDDEGYSSARRGEHYVRAHYSRDGGRGYDGRGGSYRSRDARGRYSSGDGREEMLEHLSMAMAASSEEDKEHIRRLMDKLDRM